MQSDYYGTSRYEEVLSTPSIDLVAAFICCASRVRVERDPSDDPDSDHVTFLVRGEGLSEILDQWDKGELVGNLTSYSRALKGVKARLHTYQDRSRRRPYGR